MSRRRIYSSPTRSKARSAVHDSNQFIQMRPHRRLPGMVKLDAARAPGLRVCLRQSELTHQPMDQWATGRTPIRSGFDGARLDCSSDSTATGMLGSHQR